MIINYPHTIENCLGEKIIFKSIEITPSGDKVHLEAFCKPGSGPAMHTHLMQEEELTVIKGKISYQTLGEPVKQAGLGEKILFKRGQAHKFWAEDNEPLHCEGWIHPAHNVVYFLSSVYAAQNKSGKGQPEPFDAAFLLTKYSKEFDMPEIPAFVKKVIFPSTVFIGKLLGKYKHFKDAPVAIKS